MSERGMRIMMVVDIQARGGAGIAAERLRGALRQAGHEVLMVTARPSPLHADAHTHSYADGPLLEYAVQRLGGRVSIKLESRMRQHHHVQRVMQCVHKFEPDVINVHNLHGGELPATLPARLSQIRPTVWTLHDMWAFTGTCAYSYECRGFETGCRGTCPHAGLHPALEPSQVAGAYTDRVQALRQAGRLAFVAPSRWLAQEAKRGMLAPYRVAVIPYSLDLGTYRPIDRLAARQALGLPVDHPLLFAPINMTDPRKGGQHLLEACAQLPRRPLHVVIPGSKLDTRHWPRHIRVHTPTAILDDRLMSLLYNAADLHILPTLADNLPNALLEAAACGTPSLAFNVGGVREAVEHGNTGWVIEPGSSQGLAAGIEHALNLTPAQSQHMRQCSRALAVQRYHPDLQAARYMQLFESMRGQSESITPAASAAAA